MQPLAPDEAEALTGVRPLQVVKVQGKKGKWLVLEVVKTAIDPWAILFTDYSFAPKDPKDRPGRGDILRTPDDGWKSFTIIGQHDPEKKHGEAQARRD